MQVPKIWLDRGILGVGFILRDAFFNALLEFLGRSAKRSGELWQFRRPKQQHHDNEDDDQFGTTDVPDECNSPFVIPVYPLDRFGRTMEPVG